MQPEKQNRQRVPIAKPAGTDAKRIVGMTQVLQSEAKAKEYFIFIYDFRSLKNIAKWPL